MSKLVKISTGLHATYDTRPHDTTKVEGGRVSAQYASTIYPRAAAYSSLLAGRQAGTILNLFERDNNPYVPRNLTLARLVVG